jgi:hypothetical protein
MCVQLPHHDRARVNPQQLVGNVVCATAAPLPTYSTLHSVRTHQHTEAVPRAHTAVDGNTRTLTNTQSTVHRIEPATFARASARVSTVEATSNSTLRGSLRASAPQTEQTRSFTKIAASAEHFVGSSLATTSAVRERQSAQGGTCKTDRLDSAAHRRGEYMLLASTHREHDDDCDDRSLVDRPSRPSSSLNQARWTPTVHTESLRDSCISHRTPSRAL